MIGVQRWITWAASVVSTTGGWNVTGVGKGAGERWASDQGDCSLVKRLRIRIMAPAPT